MSPEMFEPHFGIDESGKGDFFGPLVIAGAFTDRVIARSFLEHGIQDSKRIGSDAKIRSLAKMIRQTPDVAIEVVQIGPERYNDLYQKFGNLNSLLGWGHARVIENLLAKKPDCPRALSDKFADARVIERALLEHGRHIQLEQRTKAESDLAVAAASILAREAFIDWLERNGKRVGLTLGRGVSGSVKETARKIVEKEGPDGVATFRQDPFPHGARDRAGSLSPRPRHGVRGGSKPHEMPPEIGRFRRDSRQASCSLSASIACGNKTAHPQSRSGLPGPSAGHVRRDARRLKPASSAPWPRPFTF